MRRAFYILVTGLLFAGCNTTPANIKRFTRIYKDSLSGRYPTTVFRILNDSTITAVIQDNDVTISVDNAYREYLSDPDSLAATLARYTSSLDEAFDQQITYRPSMIIPVIKPVSVLDDTGRITGDSDIAYERYNEELIIQYMADTKNAMRHLHNTDVRSMNINPDSLRQLAVRNLDHLLTSIVRKGGDGVFMLEAGGDYEASIILMDAVFQKEKLPVKGDFIVAIPNRDVLLITGSDDVAGLAKVRKIASHSFETGSYPLTPYLFRWNGKLLVRYDGR